MMNHLLSASVPETHEAYDKWFTMFKSEINAVSHITRIECTDTGPHHPSLLKYAVKDTLKNHGYDSVAKFYDIHQQTKDLEPMMMKWDGLFDHVYSYRKRVKITPQNDNYVTDASEHLEETCYAFAWWDCLIENKYAYDAMRLIVMCTKKS